MNDKLKILYISSVCSKDVFDEIQSQSIIPTQVSMQKFHSTIINGLSNNKDIDIQVLSGRPVNRRKNKHLLFKKLVSIYDNVSFIHVGFLNLKIIKQIQIIIGMIKNLKRWNKQNKDFDNKVIICDGAYVSVAPFIVYFSKKLKIKSIAIVADIYDYMSDKLKERKKVNIIKKILTKACNYCWNNYDGYVLLTERMNDIVNPLNKPYVITEGIADINQNNIDANYEKEKFVMYAGGLYEKYGLKKLVDAFNLLDGLDYELHLYGRGDIVDYANEISKTNCKIKYMGTRNNDEIIKIEKEASLLINPRPTKDEYTLYSFPSKTIEYMLTGTPVLMTKLPGMPDEYLKYVYIIDDESVNGIKTKIEEILKLDDKELIERGKDAQQFIIKYKNNAVQTNKILELVNEILR